MDYGASSGGGGGTGDGGGGDGGGGGGGLRYIFRSSKTGPSLSGIAATSVDSGQQSCQPWATQDAVFSTPLKPAGQPHSVESVRNQKQDPGVQHSLPASIVEKVRLYPGAHDLSVHLA